MGRDAGSLYLDNRYYHNPGFHPKCFPSHHMMAELVFGVLHQATAEVCKYGVRGKAMPVPNISNEEEFNCTTNALSTQSAFMGMKSFHISSQGRWRFRPDRPKKVGWIASVGAPSDIVFSQIPIKRGGL